MIYPYLYSQSKSLCFLPENVAENEQAVHNFSVFWAFFYGMFRFLPVLQGAEPSVV